MSTFDKIVIGIVAVLVFLWFRPGIKAALQKGRQTEEKDWQGFLIPIIVVILFVILLIQLV